MYILGLNIGHNSTACLLKDGKIMGCVSEERFSRIKNQSGVPFKSIEYLLNENNISIKDINLIVLDDQYRVGGHFNFTEQLMEVYSRKNKVKKFLSKIGYNYPKLFKEYVNLREKSIRKKIKSIGEESKEKISKLFKLPKNKIEVIDHHLAHAFSVCFNNRNKKTLIFTLDGEGSGMCASVNIFDGVNFKIISRSKKHASLGYLYAITTLFLGMKPAEHEFKVMGMAPYAKADKVEKVYNKIKNLIWINDNLQFESKFNMLFADFFFEKEMKFERFDNISAAVQKLVEELTTEWVRRAVKKTGIRNIAVSGGVFMNVKACQKILELGEVESMFVMPSSGDESNAIGCCFYGYKKYCDANNKVKFSPKPIEDLYLGPEYDNEYIEALIKKEKLNSKYNIKKIKNINLEIAKLLAKNKIIARCSGKSEWGARALGNRSILTNPSNEDAIRILNKTIKDRDFWMPFTPSILDKFEKKYIINKKRIFAPYMVITFDSTETARKHLSAAMHPYDFTIRPQIVTKDYNKDYYEIIEKFSKLTGIGGILNTSFNLHGEPNVLTPEDALRTVENSDLKYLAMENYLFEKK